MDGRTGGESMADEEPRIGATSAFDTADRGDDRGAHGREEAEPTSRPGGGRRALLRRLTLVLLSLAGVLAVVTAGAGIWAWTVSSGHIEVAGESDDDGAARAPVAIVLGAAVHADGRPSPWLAYRLDVAADLYTSGRVEAILVSGDNRRVGYDEPTAMRDYLVGLGIPSEAIALDYAGFDTYDTCVRAHKIFGVDEALLVSQDFHVSRAVAVCRAAGVDARGVGDTRASQDRSTWAASWLRERPAAAKAAWDVATRREPTLGNRETTVDDALAWTRANRGK